MPYNLTTLPSNTTNEHCTFTPLSGTQTVWEVEFRAINGGATQVYIAGTTGFDDYIRLHAEFFDIIRIRLDATNYEFTSGSLTTNDGQFHTYKIVSDGTEISAYVDGVEIGTRKTATVQLNGFSTFFRNASSYSACAIEYFKVTENGSVTHNWSAEAAGGTGSTLPDTVGSNDATLVNFTTDDSQWGGTSSADTTAPTFSSAPAVTATTENGHTIEATLNEAGTLYGVRLANGAAAPTSAQVKAGQDSTGSAAPEAKSSAAANSASLVFSTGSASTAYDYYIVAEDDEGAPNLQASPTLVEATTGAAQVPGISAITVQKDGVAVQASDWAINITLVAGGTEVYSGSSIASDASGVIAAINASSGSVGDAVRVEGYSAANDYGFVFTQNLEDNA